MTDAEFAATTAADQPVRLTPEQARQVLEEAMQQPEAEPAALRITSVRWGRTANLGNYESARLDVEAAVAMGGDPVSTLTQLQEWVDQQAPPEAQRLNDLVERYNRTRRELTELSADLENARATWNRVMDVFKALHIEMPKYVSDELPF